MTASLLALIEASAVLEKNVAELYRLLSRRYPDDQDLWSALHREELNHSSIFESYLAGFIPLEFFPEEIVDRDLESVQRLNTRLQELFASFGTRPVDRAADYALALELETSSSEHAFQQAMTEGSDAPALRLIRGIIADDIRHAERIRERMRLRS